MPTGPERAWWRRDYKQFWPLALDIKGLVAIFMVVSVADQGVNSAWVDQAPEIMWAAQ